MKNHYSAHPIWGGISLWLSILLISFNSYAQKNKPAADLEQLRNGSLSAPENPGIWTTGNTGSSNSHHAELMSAPYRLVLTNINSSTSVVLTLEYDFKHSEKLAIDYLTSYDRLQPHMATFGHAQEEVNPTIGTALFQSPPETADHFFTIPAPSVLNSPVPGQPLSSFNNVTGAGQTQMAIWNGTITNIKYVGTTPDLSDAANQSQQIEVSFNSGTDPSGTVILAWGGHIAGRTEWGFTADGTPRSAGGISGSPYHMRLMSWNLGNLGNKDLSMSIELVSAPDVPSTPENFSATAVSTSQINLNWDEVASSKTLTYTLERSPNGTNSWVEISSLPQTTTNFSDQGLSEFTKYFYRIFASTEDGMSEPAFAMARTHSALSSSTKLNGKSEDKIGLPLTSLALGTAGSSPSDLVYQFDEDGDVLVEIIAFRNPNTIAAVIDLLQNKYQRSDDKFVLDPGTYITEDRNLIDVYFPINRLEELNFEEVINFVRTVYRPFLESIGATGVLSQGDSSQASLDVRASFKITRTDSIGGQTDTVFVDGFGERIGVISNSFNTQPFSGTDSRYVTDQKNLDLPGPFNPNFPTPVEILEDSPFTESDEGRAMTQILHDAAPGADLGFHTGTLSLNKFIEAVDELSLAGYPIIVDDITFLGESFFNQEGPVYEAFNDHLSVSGSAIVSSAGNFSDRSLQGILNFVPIPANEIYPPGTTAFIHDFGSGDYFQEIFANEGEYVLVFQWNQPFTSLGDPVGAFHDLDMYIVNDSLAVEAGNNRINIEGDAAEYLVFTASSTKGANLVFTCECDTPPSNLAYRMIAFKTDGTGDGLVFTEPISSPTVSGHAMFDFNKLVTTGASFYGFYGTGAGPVVEPFSSFGGMLPDGQTISVDITGPDGANTNVISIGTDINFDPDIFPNFFGTSAAAPHVAAAIALLRSALPVWYPGGVPAEFYTDPSYATSDLAEQALGLFLQTATPVGNTEQAGAGLINVEEAFRTVATQTSVLTGFTYDNSKVISVDTVIVTLQGDYFTEDSQVLLNGDSVETTFISENELQAVIPPFTGTAGLAVDRKPSTTPSGVDGGNSNPIDLLEGRRAITIVADDAFRTFGQDFDNLSFTALGLVGDETYDSLGLPEVVLNSTAVGPFPDVGNYIITPGLANPLSEEQQNEFIIAFQPGVLSITSLPLTIQVVDTTAIYGDEPIVELQYIYDSTGISNNALFLNTLKTEHQSTYLVDSVDNGLVNRFSAVVNRFSAVVNENPDRIDELIDLLSNSNWLATETTIENRFSPVVNEFNIVPIDADQLLDYLDNPLVGNSGALENRFSAVVNGDDLVNGLVSVYDPLENRFSAVVNRFSAVVNRFSAVVNVPLGDENDSTDLSQTLAIVDAEDGGSTVNDTVNVYSINLITGLDVTLTNEERHYMVSGAALAPIFTNCELNYEPGRLTINPRPLTVDLDDGEEEPFEIIYGDPTPTFTSTTGPLAYSDEIDIQYELNPPPTSTNPVSAGNYEVVQKVEITDSLGAEVTSNYDLTIINGTLIVSPGTLKLNTEDVIITSGDDIPASSINTTITGFISGEDILDVFGGDPSIGYSSPDYESAGRVEGAYDLFTTLLSPLPENYLVLGDTSSLLVNPPTGKKIDVFLDCVSELEGNEAFPFEVFFSYTNKNTVSVFIPPGPLNELTCTSCDASQLPTEFLPGTHSFSIPFDGAEVRWKLTSFDITNPSSVSVDGNDVTGNKCKGQGVPNGRIAQDATGEENLIEDISKEVQFYPNPVDDHLVVRVSKDFSTQDYQLYDSRGILYSVNVVIDPVQSTAEFDFSNFETGLYLLKLNLDGNTTIIRILRQ